MKSFGPSFDSMFTLFIKNKPTSKQKNKLSSNIQKKIDGSNSNVAFTWKEKLQCFIAKTLVMCK
jgi:hypothetical protein